MRVLLAILFLSAWTAQAQTEAQARSFLIGGGNGTNAIPTNMSPFVTVSVPTNAFTFARLYTNLAQRSLLIGSVNIAGTVTSGGKITLLYTNNGVGYQLPMQTGLGVIQTNSYPFCVPLSPNATFFFATNFGAGSTGSVTNVVLWQQ